MDNTTKQIMDLWRICFPEDTEEFVRFYFARKYRRENTLLMFRGNTVVSSLQMLPYDMTFHGQEIKTAYLSGVCTHPSVRNKGFMFNLLKNALEEMHSQGIVLTTLIPASEALFDYYRKVGYTPVFDYAEEHYFLKKTQMTPVTQIFTDNTVEYVLTEWNPDDNPDDIYLYFRKKEQERPVCLQHSKEEFCAVVEDFYNDGGVLFFLKNNSGCSIDCRVNSSIKGIAFVWPLENKIRIKEFFFDGMEEKEFLLWSIAQRYNTAEEIICQTEPCGKTDTDFHFGMARVTDALFFLTFYAKIFPEKTLTLKINDSIIERNNGAYILKNGICEKTTNRLAIKNGAPEVSIEQFTQAVLGYQTERLPEEIAGYFPTLHPYMNLMMN